MRYFTECKTAEDVKARFKELAKQLHPDCGGDAEEFKRMMQEYTAAYNRLKDVHATKEGKTYKETRQEKKTTQSAEAFADIISAIIGLDGIKIEICGTWVWITGNTYPHRTTLAAAGFRWSKSKKAWYNAGEPLTGKKHRAHYSSMKAIRAAWGSEEIDNTARRQRIAG